MAGNTDNHYIRAANGEDSHEWRLILPVAITFLAVAVLAVLRFIARRIRRADIRTDDLLIFIGVVIFAGYVTTSRLCKWH